MEITFGAYVKEKRSQIGISLRELAQRLDITPSYLSDIEKGRRNAPEKRIIEKLIGVLEIPELELPMFYDLAGQTKSEVPPDLPAYINENDKIRALLRTAKKNNTSDKTLEEIIKMIEEKKE